MKKILFLLIVLILAACDDPNSDKLVTIKTNFGEMTVLLYDETPLHKANFIELVESGKYDSTIFHRVMENFMIQGGDIHLDKGTLEQPSDQIPAEIVDGLFHKKGELAAARQPDQVNPEKKSSSCQFYIVQGIVSSKEALTTDQYKLNAAIGQLIRMEGFDSLNQQFIALQQEQKFQEMNDLAIANKELCEQTLGINLSKEMSPEKLAVYSTVGGVPSLDGGYTVFGRVVEGLEVIDKIAAVETYERSPGLKNLPVENIYTFMEVTEMSKSEITEKYGYVYLNETK